jgi:hypothetical protein
MAKRSQFWAAVCGTAAAPVAVIAGIAGGAVRSASGNSAFTEGFEATAKPILEAAEEFGAEHGELITKGLLGGAAAAVGRRLITEGIKHVFN